MSNLSRTSLTPYAASMRDPDPKKSHEACRRAFHEGDVLLIRLDAETEKRLGWANMQMLRNLGELIYGKGRK